MKQKTKKLLAFLTAVLLTVGCAGCGDKADDGNSANKGNGENFIQKLAYQVFATQEDGKTVRVEITILSLDREYKLSEIMQRAHEEHKLTYESSAGMVTSINGTANTADFSYCWMLYTTDAEMANSSWGTITIGDQTLGSAIVGAEALEVLENEMYVWEYTAF